MFERVRRGGPWLTIAAWSALVAHLVLGFFPYAFTGLLAPPWAVVVLFGAWLVLGAAGLAWRKQHPWRTVAVPFLAYAVWFIALTLGDVLLGWTA